jgi:hypothetical protein
MIIKSWLQTWLLVPDVEVVVICHSTATLSMGFASNVMVKELF